MFKGTEFSVYKIVFILLLLPIIFFLSTIIDKIDNISQENGSIQRVFLINEPKEVKISRLSKLAGVKIPSTIDIKHLELMETTANYYDIPLRLFLRMIYAESEFKPRATSYKGAFGYLQLMPSTYTRYKDNLFIKHKTPENNIRIGGLILKDLKQQYKSWKMALVAYNSGPNGVKNNKYLQFKETVKYVNFVMK